MKVLVAATAAGLIFLMAGASSSQGADTLTLRLQCEGNYSQFYYPEIRDVAVKGILFEVSSDRVSVNGAVRFDGEYRVAGNFETGIGIVLTTNSLAGGYLNRFSGEFNLAEKKDANSTQLNAFISGTCVRARALF